MNAISQFTERDVRMCIYCDLRVLLQFRYLSHNAYITLSAVDWRNAVTEPGLNKTDGCLADPGNEVCDDVASVESAVVRMATPFPKQLYDRVAALTKGMKVEPDDEITGPVAISDP